MVSMPLMKPIEIELINRYMGPDVNMLEYGSGASTSYYAARVKNLTSIEYNKDWYQKVKLDLENAGQTNVDLVLIKCPKEKPGTYKTYQKYIEWPLAQDQVWDLVLIDGRCRSFCAKSVLPKITKESVVLVHDWGPLNNPDLGPKRPRYNTILEDYEVIEQAHTLVALRKK